MTNAEMDDRTLSTAEIAERIGVAESDVARWQALGLLGPPDGPGPAALQRARLLAFAESRGVSATSVAEADRRDPSLLDRFVDIVGAPEETGVSIAAAAAETGLDVAFARRLRTASGLPTDQLEPDDLDALRAVRLALDVGVPDEALLQLVRVFADALGRVADAEVRLFHFYFHERLRAAGHAPDEIGRATDEAARVLLTLMEPTVGYFHRKAWTAAMREDMLSHFAEEVAPPDGPLGELPVTVLFVDLAGFTPLTEAMGDASAAEVIDRFSEMVREEAIPSEGRVVKQIGDEFMLVFATAGAAVEYAQRLATRAVAESHFPRLRMGAHHGSALYREADYLGATVNIAARVAGQAERGELLVTAAVRDALGDRGPSMEALGPRALKGVTAPVELYRVALPEAAHRVTDPVCGMELARSDDLPSSEWDGRRVTFCSDDCRTRFLGDPAKYSEGTL